MENKPPPSPRNNNTIVATEICEPVTAVEIYPLHSLYTIASDYIDVDVDDIENNVSRQESILFEPPKQDCCPSPFVNRQLCTRCCACCLISTVCFGFIIAIWSFPR